MVVHLNYLIKCKLYNGVKCDWCEQSNMISK
jgi:hypothetical protein